MRDPDWSNHCGDRWRAHVAEAVDFDICDVIGPMPRRAAEWVAMMRRLAVHDMAGVINAVHGPAINPRFAARGDIVQRGWAIGICRGENAEFFGGTMLPMREVNRAWRLGDL